MASMITVAVISSILGVIGVAKLCKKRFKTKPKHREVSRNQDGFDKEDISFGISSESKAGLNSKIQEESKI